MQTRIRQRLYVIIFGTNTRAGKNFDIALLVFIVMSVTLVILESIESYRSEFKGVFVNTEWFFTIVFTLEYLLRIYSHPKPLKYMTSFLGIIDFMAILPSYLGLVIDQTNFLLVVRAFRLIRVFRILKLRRYISEADILAKAMRESLHKIIVFYEVILILVLFLGTIMYMVEGKSSGFNSIPQSIYWAIVTVTTVGYGDIAPVTVVGKIIASFAMLTGYSIIAVPTGIITVEIGRLPGRMDKKKKNTCQNCGHSTTEDKPVYCSKCGEKLENNSD